MMKKERLYVFLCVLILVFYAACGKTDEADREPAASVEIEMTPKEETFEEEASTKEEKINASTTSYEHFENFLAEQYSVLAMQELHWAGI